MFRLAVFDVDGTLIDTERTGVESIRKTVLELTGRELSDAEAAVGFGLSGAAAASYYGYADAAVFTRRWEENFISLSYLITVFPGIEDVVRSLKAAGIATAIVTSRNRFEVDCDPVLDTLRPMFDLIVTADDTPRHKPAPDPMLICLDRLGIPAGETIYFGDTSYDYQCATASGCAFALADWKNRGLQGIPADYHCRTAEDFSAIFD